MRDAYVESLEEMHKDVEKLNLRAQGYSQKDGASHAQHGCRYGTGNP